MAFKRFGRRMKGGLRDQRGGIIVSAALAMMPITMLAFAAVEFANVTRYKNELQGALDAASLAVARAPVGATETQLRNVYVAVLQSHLSLKPGLVELVSAPADPATNKPAQPHLTLVNGRVNAGATLSISPIIASFFMDGNIKLSGTSEVLRESRGLEVALVLDDTASMTINNRIGIAKSAATNFVTELENASAGSSTVGAVKIGVVPFAGTVNVGSTYQGQTWMDPNAQSPIHSEIFSTAAGAATTQNRWTLLSTMQIPWAGCVESRPMPYDVQETAPTSGTPATLFVPHFYPDEADYIPNTAADAAAGRPAMHSRFSDWNNVSPSGIQPYPATNQWVQDLIPAFGGYDPHPQRRWLAGLWSGWVVPSKPNGYTDAQDRDNVHALFATAHGGASTTTGGLTPQKVFGKYTLANVNAEVAAGRFNRLSTDKGPNQNCKMPAITRLTTNTAAVKTAISGMAAASLNTNVPMGMVWGWHLLSPLGPFADGASYTKPRNTKVLVLMTDGENFINSSGSINGAHYSGVGYPHQNRVGATDLAGMTAALDNRLSVLCTNVKNAGVVVYTIRVEVTGPNTLLQNCASSPDKAFDVTQASQLDSAFKTIARSIQNLRITA
jgi:Flp pilus assembly protein TadG